MTEDKFKWDENNVTELLYHLSKKTNWVHSQMCKWAEDFKQSKLQSQDKQVGWEILELIFWSGEKTTDFLVIQNWLRGDKRYEKWSIYSVKRLSDGEVFTVGDKVTWGIHEDWETQLTGFEIIENRLKFYDSKLPQGIRPRLS